MKGLDLSLKHSKNHTKGEKGFSHQKGNTQSINIYKILHSGKHLKVQVPESRTHVTTNLESTCDAPLKPCREKSKHDQKLEQELKEYQAEVEFKFSHSEVNRNYRFPRRGEAVEERKELRKLLASIYDAPQEKRVRENSAERRAKVLVIKKSHSQEKNTSKPNGVFCKLLRNFIKPKLEKMSIKELVSTKPKVVFSNTQKINFDRQTNESAQSYLGVHLQRGLQKGEFLHSEATESDSQNAKLCSTKTCDNVQRKNTHCRNHTIGSSDNKSIRNALHSTKSKKPHFDAKHYKSNSRVNKRTIYLSDLLRSTAAHKGGASRSTNKIRLATKCKERSQFNNTLSLSTFLSKTRHRKGTLNSKCKQK